MPLIADLPTLAQLWERTRTAFARLRAAFGSAATIAALGPIPRCVRREIAGWLARLESIARRLLLSEAAQLKLTQAPEAGAAGRLLVVAPSGNQKDVRESARQPTPSPALDLTQPHTWPARFALSLPRAYQHKSRTYALRDPSAARGDHALRFARRFEALRRVLENPTPHAERLLRLMTRHGRMAMEYAAQQARPYTIDYRDPRLCVEACACSMRDAYTFIEDSS